MQGKRIYNQFTDGEFGYAKERSTFNKSSQERTGIRNWKKKLKRKAKRAFNRELDKQIKDEY